MRVRNVKNRHAATKKIVHPGPSAAKASHAHARSTHLVHKIDAVGDEITTGK